MYRRLITPNERKLLKLHYRFIHDSVIMDDVQEITNCECHVPYEATYKKLKYDDFHFDLEHKKLYISTKSEWHKETVTQLAFKGLCYDLGFEYRPVDCLL